MANVCKYKIKVNGTKISCLALVNMMPLYCGEKEILSVNGTDECFSMTFSGDCKWSVDAYTQKHKNLSSLSKEEIEQINDGMYWDYPLSEKSLMLNCEIFCVSADIDEETMWPYHEHYINGERNDENFPMELELIPGYDYNGRQKCIWEDFGTHGCKVQVDGKTKWYAGTQEVGDVVYVSTNGANMPGRVLEVAEHGIQRYVGCIIGCIGNVKEYNESDIEMWWKSKKPNERVENLSRLGFSMDNKITKDKFMKWTSEKWTIFGLNHTWQEFVHELDFGHTTLIEQSCWFDAMELLYTD